jgi:hypothetical protein
LCRNRPGRYRHRLMAAVGLHNDVLKGVIVLAIWIYLWMKSRAVDRPRQDRSVIHDENGGGER